MLIAEITAAHIERWRATLTTSARTRNKLLIELHGIFRRAHKLYGLRGQPGCPRRAAARAAPRRTSRCSRRRRCARWCAPRPTSRTRAIYLTAAFTGLRRGELLALRWRDVDFATSTLRVRACFAAGELTSPKSGKVRVPCRWPREVATALARLGQRGRFTGDDDLVFPGELGGYLDGSALRRRYERARSPRPACGRCASTTCATRSARG